MLSLKTGEIMATRIIHGYKRKSVKHPYGLIYEMLKHDESMPEGFNIALAEISGDNKHYHKRATEIYLLLEGFSHLELDEKFYSFYPGDIAVIEPDTRHKIWPSNNAVLKFLVLSYPPWSPEDEFYD